MKAVPGSKTDVKDAEWLADLLRHGLLKPSFIPDRWQRELRELVRYRKALVEERSRLVTCVQKLLEGDNIKLGDVTTDVMGASGRAMLKQLAAGKKDTAKMAQLAQAQLRNRIREFEQALTGSVGKHQRFMLDSLIRLLEEIEDEIRSLDEEVEKRMRPFRAAVALLDEIPGIGTLTAEAVLAEIGIDMSRFATAAHIAS